jgi:hypothetical protein
MRQTDIVKLTEAFLQLIFANTSKINNLKSVDAK